MSSRSLPLSIKNGLPLLPVIGGVLNLEMKRRRLLSPNIFIESLIQPLLDLFPRFRLVKLHSSTLQTGYCYENQFRNPGFMNGVRQFCENKIFILKYYFILFLYILYFFESLRSKSKETSRLQQGNSEVVFNSTLLNSGSEVGDYINTINTNFY